MHNRLSFPSVIFGMLLGMIATAIAWTAPVPTKEAVAQGKHIYANCRGDKLGASQLVQQSKRDISKKERK